MRKAFTATLHDKDFLADADKGNFEVRPVAGTDVQTLVGTSTHAPRDRAEGRDNSCNSARKPDLVAMEAVL